MIMHSISYDWVGQSKESNAIDAVNDASFFEIFY